MWTEMLGWTWPDGVKLMPVQSSNRIEVIELSQYSSRERLGSVNQPASMVIGGLLKAVRTLRSPLSNVGFTDFLHTRELPSGGRQLLVRTEDPRIVEENKRIAAYLGHLIGAETEWPAYPVDMLLASAPCGVPSENMSKAQSIISGLFPIGVNLQSASIFPK